MTQTTEQELLADYVASGSSEAFSRIVERHSAMVYSACLRVLGDAHAAEDATQATFLAFMRRAQTLHARSLGAWLYMTAIGAARNMRRSAVRRSKHERVKETMATPATKDAAADELWPELKGQLDDALTALPASQREAVVLRYLNGCSDAEAAHQLGCSERTLRARVQYGLEKLRGRLKGQGVTVSGAMLTMFLAERCIETPPLGLAAKLTVGALGSASAAAKTAATSVLKKAAVAKLQSVAVTAMITLTAVSAAAGGVYWQTRPKTPAVEVVRTDDLSHLSGWTEWRGHWHEADGCIVSDPPDGDIGPILESRGSYNNYELTCKFVIENGRYCEFLVHGRDQFLSVNTDPQVWHELHVSARGNTFKMILDGVNVAPTVNVEANSLKTGSIGFYVKSKGVLRIKELKVQVLKD